MTDASPAPAPDDVTIRTAHLVGRAACQLMQDALSAEHAERIRRGQFEVDELTLLSGVTPGMLEAVAIMEWAWAPDGATPEALADMLRAALLRSLQREEHRHPPGALRRQADDRAKQRKRGMT